MHSLLFISPQNAVLRRGEEPRKIFIGKFHRISYRSEIEFNKREERISQTPCLAKCFINVELLKSLILKRKEGCYCKKELNRTVNKSDEKSKVYGTHADKYRLSSSYPSSLKYNVFPSCIHKYTTVEKGDTLASVLVVFWGRSFIILLGMRIILACFVPFFSSRKWISE